MSAIDIKGRDLGSATGGTLPVSFSPINLGVGAGAGASSGAGGAPGGLSPLAIVLAVILAIAAIFLTG